MGAQEKHNAVHHLIELYLMSHDDEVSDHFYYLNDGDQSCKSDEVAAVLELDRLFCKGEFRKQLEESYKSAEEYNNDVEREYKNR